MRKAEELVCADADGADPSGENCWRGFWDVVARSWTGVESISAARICDRFLPTGIGVTGEAASSITDYTAR